jgi:hypothetical protein
MIISIPGIVSQGGGLDKSLVYQLPSAMTFNGTSTYIDTGIKLFDTPKDFTIFVDFNDEGTRTHFDTVYHCMYEGKINGYDYPGHSLDYRKFTTGNKYEGYAMIVSPGSYWKGTGYISAGKNIRSAVVFKAGVFSNWVWSNNYGTPTSNFVLVTGSSLPAVPNYVSHSVPLAIGCYRTTTGSRGRFWQGRINDFRVWERALTDTEVNALF